MLDAAKALEQGDARRKRCRGSVGREQRSGERIQPRRFLEQHEADGTRQLTNRQASDMPARHYHNAIFFHANTFICDIFTLHRGRRRRSHALFTYQEHLHDFEVTYVAHRRDFARRAAAQERFSSFRFGAWAYYLFSFHFSSATAAARQHAAI